MEDSTSLVQYETTDDILQDMRGIIDVSREKAYQAVNLALVRRNWLLGYRIAQEILKGGERAEYGLEVIKKLSKELTRELGKGYAFVARQQHIHTEKQDYFIDLVFYNYILKCFVLIDLKMGKITHQDVGQMDMYIRMYDELKRGADDNPTLGIVLCSETDEDVARYSVMHGSEQLFASKYKLYLPTEEELRAEIEAQKAIFYLQQKDEQNADN
ncbi:MAG: DUF1016 family protein [Thermoguttaceae bacterium]|nr:DUF1016 family protein [Thermoguttaceae bacterium]